MEYLKGIDIQPETATLSFRFRRAMENRPILDFSSCSGIIASGPPSRPLSTSQKLFAMSRHTMLLDDKNLRRGPQRESL